MRHCPGAAVLLRAAHFHMHATVIESCDVGVEVAANAADVLLEDNRFVNDRVGVRFGAPNANTAVVRNTFTHATAAGLWAVRGEAGRSARRGHSAFATTTSRTTTRAWSRATSRSLVEHNEFSANAPEAAVHLIGAGAAIRGNHIAGPAALGIVAEYARGAVIEGNELDGLSSYALMLRSSAGAIVRANRVAGCALTASRSCSAIRSIRARRSATPSSIRSSTRSTSSATRRSSRTTRSCARTPCALRVMDYAQPGGQSVSSASRSAGQQLPREHRRDNPGRAGDRGSRPAMTERLPTQILPVFDWLDPRAHPLGDTWLLTIFTILLAIGRAAVSWAASRSTSRCARSVC